MQQMCYNYDALKLLRKAELNFNTHIHLQTCYVYFITTVSAKEV